MLVLQIGKVNSQSFVISLISNSNAAAALIREFLLD